MLKSPTFPLSQIYVIDSADRKRFEETGQVRVADPSAFVLLKSQRSPLTSGVRRQLSVRMFVCPPGAGGAAG